MGTDLKVKGLVKFADSLADEQANAYGIQNSRGQIVTNTYLARYIQCWCRVGNGYTANRKANFAHFMSAEFLSNCTGLTASQVGRKASLDERWGIPAKISRKAGAPAPAQEPVIPVELVSVDELAESINARFESVMAAVDTAIASEPAEQVVVEATPVVSELVVVSEPVSQPAEEPVAPVIHKSKKQLAREVKSIVHEMAAVAA
jgi:hypothetical protein